MTSASAQGPGHSFLCACGGGGSGPIEPLTGPQRPWVTTPRGLLLAISALWA